MIGEIVFVGIVVWASNHAIKRERRAHAETRAVLMRLGDAAIVKDFNVLYRVARRYLEQGCDGEPEELSRQLARLEPAFTDTEEVRRLMRERKGER